MPERPRRGRTTQKRAPAVRSGVTHFSIRAVTTTVSISSASSTFSTTPSLTFLCRISVLPAARPVAVWKWMVISGPRSDRVL